MAKEMIFNQYTGGDESLKFWDGVKMFTLNDEYFWNEEEFRDWIWEKDMNINELINKANSWGIQYNPQNRMFYLPKGSELRTQYYEGQKILDVEYYYNGNFVDSIDTTDDIRVEFETKERKVELTVKAIKEIYVDASSDRQAIAIVREMFENGDIEFEDDDYDTPNYECGVESE